MISFASITDLQARLGQTFPVEAATQVSILLEDASTYLRAVIGQDVYPASTVTFDIWVTPGAQVVRIPVQPVRAVTAVTVDGTAVPVILAGDTLLLAEPARSAAGGQLVQVVVTADAGLATAPAELVSWCCVLTSQVLKSLAELESLGSGEVTSLAIDDYRKGFAGGATGAFDIPERTAQRLRAQYGGGTYVLGSQ